MTALLSRSLRLPLRQEEIPKSPRSFPPISRWDKGPARFEWRLLNRNKFGSILLIQPKKISRALKALLKR